MEPLDRYMAAVEQGVMLVVRRAGWTKPIVVGRHAFGDQVSRGHTCLC